jgi:hypothetical protein
MGIEMNIESIGSVPASAAGSPLAQSTGASVERAAQVAAARQSRVQSNERADSAAGISETDASDMKPEDRDADGRQPWEQLRGGSPSDESSMPNTTEPPDAPGRGLDLTA